MPTVTQYLQRVVAGVNTPLVGQWVQLVNNLTETAYVSLNVTDPNGMFTVVEVPAGTYSVNISPDKSTWVTTGDTNFNVGDENNWLNVQDYGALGDGVTDDTTAIQNALNDASNFNHGGTVWVPPTANGYLCNGTLIVPPYVTLAGSYRDSPGVGQYVRLSGNPPQTYKGSTLLSTANAGSTSNTLSFIQLRRGARLTGMAVFYPNQTATNPPVQYPPTVWFFTDYPASPVTHFGAAIVNCLLVNPYWAVYCVNHEKPYINGLYGQPLNTGLYIDGMHDVGRIQNVHFWQFWSPIGTNPNLDKYINTTASAFQFLDVDGLQFDNLFSYGYFTGFTLGSSGVGGYGAGVNIGAEQCARGIVVNEIAAAGWQLSNIDIITGGGGGQQPNTATARGLLVASSTFATSGEIQIDHMTIENGLGAGVEILAAAHQPVKISQSRIHDWNSANSAIKTASTDADLHVTDTTFWSNNSNHLDISALDNTAVANIVWRQNHYYSAHGETSSYPHLPRISYGATVPKSLRGIAGDIPYFDVMDFGAKGDGSTDDTSAIQKAINAGKVIIFPPGFTYLVSQLTIPSGVVILADGATIKQKASSNESMVLFNSVAHTGTQIIGGTWDGNGTNQTGTNNVIDGGSATSYDNLLLERLVVKNASGHGIFVSESSHNNSPKRILGCEVIDYGLQGTAFGIYADYVGSIDIDACYVNSALGYDCYELGHSGITYLSIDGNMRLRGSTANQRSVAGAGINFPFSESAQIIDNTCIGSGIWNDTNTANKVTIKNNKIRSCTPATGYAGIRYGGSNGLIEGNDVEVTTNDGIALQGTTSKGNIVKGNRVYSSAGAHTGNAYVDGTGVGPTDNLFDGNEADGANGAGFTNLVTFNGTHEKAHGNKVGPNGGVFNGINDAGGSNDIDGNDVSRVFNIPVPTIQTTTVARNNLGYNPVGVVSPGVPSSGSPVAAVAYDRTFYITTGAAATTMAISGGPTITLQASTAGQVVRVPATKTLTPTYTNAPTWVVEGE